jgi:hypothetical protein
MDKINKVSSIKKIEKNTQQAAIKAPQAIVHIKHTISLRQYKYWVLLLQELKDHFDAGETPDEDGFFSVSVEKITDRFGYLPVKAEFKSDLSALRREPIAFNILEKDGGKAYYEAGFISEFKVTTKKIRYKFPSFLEKVARGLDEPKAMFSLLNWDIFNHFSGKYEAIIYKLCKDYAGAGRTPKMELEEFREYMGIKPQEYKNFKDLNKFVISSSSNAINKSEISDITVEPEFLRQGRKVTGLFFRVSNKRQTSLFPEIEEITAFLGAKSPINPTLQAKYLQDRQPEEIKLCIDRANEYGAQQEKAGKSVNYGALYRRAISEGWHVQQIERQAQELAKAKEKAQKQESENQQKAAKHQEEERKKQESADLWARFEALPDDEKEKIISGILEEGGAFLKADYKKRGAKSLLLKGEIFRVMKDRE